jgi:hypothetical protein
MLTSAGYAGTSDFSDRSEYTCDADTIKDHMDDLMSGNPNGIKIIYVKDNTVEVSRTKNELRCRATVVTNSGSVPGVFHYFNQDGRSLLGFLPGKSK